MFQLFRTSGPPERARTRERHSSARRIGLAGAAAACMLLASCTDEYTGIIRKAVMDAGGVDQANLVLLEKARRGNGRDLYIYSVFLNKYLPESLDPAFASWPHNKRQDADAFFNCAVAAGFQHAIDRVRERLRQARAPEATAVLTCFDQKRNSRITWSSQSWTTCGVEKFFPACPI
jgi:hypothetical protein